MAGGQLNQFMQDYRRSSSRAGTDQTDEDLLKRFVTYHDDQAFEALVQRYGPMVLGVCRRLLHDVHAAEDAFQATFMVLVRKAGSLSQPHLLGNWLYGVAYRVAVKARANAARRSAHERQAASMPRAESNPDAEVRELRAVLDEEINHLPEKYRAPLVLCYLEGKTNEQAATMLGCPLGSMSWRLARGREMLRQRLNRRNLAFGPMLFPPLLAQQTASVTMPSALVTTTVQAGVAVAKTGTTVGAVSVSVSSLTEETLRSLALAQLAKMGGTAASLFLCFLLLLFGAYQVVFNSGGPEPVEGAIDHACKKEPGK
jgi:RNA polymerase sigma factor (sigma-70 family)